MVEEDILHALRHRVSVENAVAHRLKGAKVKLKAMSALLHTAMHSMGGGSAGGSGADKNTRLKKD